MIRKYMLLMAALVLTFTVAGAAQADGENGKSVYVRMDTSEGPIVMELWPEKAPATVRNFLKYAMAGFYEETIFHRVIAGFMIQGGGMKQDFRAKDAMLPIKNEADNGLKNKEYTVAMARTNDPHSASSQFFINTKNNAFLDYKASTMKGWGYCVFGQVIAGKATVDKIEKTRTSNAGSYTDVPVKPITITKVAVVER